MPELQNIGGGAGILDLAPYTGQLMQLRQLQDAQATRGLENLKNQVQIQKDLGDIQRQPFQLEETKANAAQQKEKFIQDTFNAALSGDYQRATEGYQQITGKPDVVLPHPDPGKRASGYIILANPATGQKQEIDTLGATKAKQLVDTQADLIKRAAEGSIATPTDVSTLAQTLLEKGYAESPAEAASQAKTFFEASNRKVVTADGKTMRLGDLPKQTIANLGESATMVNAAINAPVGNAPPTTDPNARLVAKKDIPDEDRKDLEGLFNTNKTLLRDLIPQFMALKNDPNALSTNVATARIRDLGKYFDANDPRYTALQSALGDLLLKVNKHDVGRFSESEFAMRQKLFPNASDTLDQAIAKASALAALNVTSANTKIQGLEATDHKVGQLKQLFSGVGTPNVPGAEAQSILNALPPEILNNRKMMNDLVQVLPPAMKDAANAMVSKKGTPLQGGVQDLLNRGLKLGQ